MGTCGNKLGETCLQGTHEEDLAEDREDREKWTGFHCILEMELTVLADELDAEDEGIEVMENPWVSGLVNFVDRLSFATLVPLTRREGTGFRNRLRRR